MATDGIEAAAGRLVNGLIRVTMGGAQLRTCGQPCDLCRVQCLQLARMTIEQQPGGPVISARRYCDGQAIFSGVPAGPRTIGH